MTKIKKERGRHSDLFDFEWGGNMAQVTMECYNAHDHRLISKLARAPISLEANNRLYAARHMTVADMRFFDVLDIGDSASMMQPVPLTETQPYATRFSRMQMTGMGITYGMEGYVPYHIYKQSNETILVFFHNTIAKPVLLSFHDHSLHAEAVSYIDALGAIEVY